MRNVVLPDPAVRPLPFYLALEEYVLEKMEEGDDDCFFLWQVKPTVIFGRNQIGSREVDLDYCSSHGIDVYRRKSGGGCVFANPDNIMMSYITRSGDSVDRTYARYTTMIVDMLASLGIEADASERNDILIDGRKVSGNAYYRTERGSIVHGTMLFDTDREQMSRALTPSRRKLAAKGVSSVGSRITTLREHTGIGIEAFKRHAVASLCDSQLRLGDADIAAVEKIAAPYFTDEWRWGFDRRAARTLPRRIEGAGEFVVDLGISPVDNTIRSLNLAGDFFVTADIDRLIVGRLRGVRADRESVAEALRGVDVSQIISGLSTNQFINLIL